MDFALLQEAWDPAGHAEPASWLELLGLGAPWVLLAVLVVALVRAVGHGGRYRALEVLDEGAQERVHEALRAAERTTVGEVVPVVVERSDPHPAADWLAAVTFLLVGSGALAPHLPWSNPAFLIAVQVAFGLLGFALARALPGFKRMFVKESRASEVSAEQAFQEFYGNGLHKTEASTGVLLFVSLLERRVHVLADEGIAAKVPPETWKHVDDAILEGVRRGDLCAGLVHGIEAAGQVLAEHFPWEQGDRNELPDRLILRRE